jgi:hypothetical protein
VLARATDTGGNATDTDRIVVALVQDATGPRLIGRHPATDAVVFAFEAIVMRFNEPLNPATLTAASFRLSAAGDDGTLGTADDLPVAGELAYDADANLLAYVPSARLPSGRYRASLNPVVTDLAGNPLANPLTWDFTVLDLGGANGPDSDGDGIADLLERLLGLDPRNPLDAERDLDGDGLGTATELRLGLNPLASDSDGNGINDREDDADHDGLSNGEEIARGTDPLKFDTDGDGWSDEAEITAHSDPLSAASKPFVGAFARPAVELLAPRAVSAPGAVVGVTLAKPAVELLAPRAVFGSGGTSGITLARPPVEVLAPRVVFGSEGSFGMTFARPPLELLAPRVVFGSGSSVGITLARPPLEVLAPEVDPGPRILPGPTLARPPLTLEFKSE